MPTNVSLVFMFVFKFTIRGIGITTNAKSVKMLRPCTQQISIVTRIKHGRNKLERLTSIQYTDCGEDICRNASGICWLGVRENS